MLIRGLVYADSGDEALAAAKSRVFNRLVQDNVFDYYVTADMDGRGVSGTDRWGDYPEAVPVESDEGRELVEDGWEYTVQEYDRALDQVEEFLDEYDRSALWEDEAAHMQYSYPFHKIGQFQGPSTFLYDQYGQGVRSRGHLDRLLTNEHNFDGDLYVAPADVHY